MHMYFVKCLDQSNAYSAQFWLAWERYTVVFYWLELGPDLGNQDALKQANQQAICQ